MSTSLAATHSPRISPAHETILAKSAIPIDEAKAWGIRTVSSPDDLYATDLDTRANRERITKQGGGLLFPLRTLGGAVTYQLRLDIPEVDQHTGKPTRKYIQASGKGSVIHVPEIMQKRLPTATRVLVVEGTKQAIATTIAAREIDGLAVVAVQGCRNWSSGSVAVPEFVEILSGRQEVYLALDADWQSNPNVFDAAKALRETAFALGASTVKLLQVPGGKTAGLDDWLGRQVDHDARPAMLTRLMDLAVDKLGRRPAAKKAVTAARQPLKPAGQLTERQAAQSALRARAIAWMLEDGWEQTDLDNPVYNQDILEVMEELAAADEQPKPLTIIEGNASSHKGLSTVVDQVQTPAAASQIVHQQLTFSTEWGAAQRWALYEGAHWRATILDDKKTQYYRWTGKVWEKATIADLRLSMLRVANAVRYLEAEGYAEAYAKRGGEAAIAYREELELADRFERPRFQNDVAALIAAIPGIRVEDDAWDADPLLLNTPSGVWDFRTGECAPHDPHYLQTKITVGSGARTPVTPQLQKQLDALGLSNEEFPAFISNIMGVAVTGLSPALFMTIYGRGGVGKSTLLESLATAMGPYAAQISAKALAIGAGSGEGPTPTLNRLRGKRFVWIDESGQARFDTDLLKMLTSGGTISTRTHHGEDKEWRSQITLACAANTEVKLGVDDEGITRRLYPVKLTEKPVIEDPSIKAHLTLTQEGWDAVLSLAIQAAIGWIARGGKHGDVTALNVPDAVIAGRDAYLSPSDPIREWWDTAVEELDEPSKATALTTGTLHAIYIDWMREHGKSRYACDITRFVTRLEARGHKPTAQTVRKGVRGRFVDTIRVTVTERVQGRRVTDEAIHTKPESGREEGTLTPPVPREAAYEVEHVEPEF